MKKRFQFFILFLFTLGFTPLQGIGNTYEVLTASNDANRNELLVYDANGKLLQAISTDGQGGVPPHIVGGGIAKTSNFVAVINYNSQTVSLFKQQQGAFKLLQVLPTLSKPVSLAFGNNYLYILGTTTIESHAMSGNGVNERPDGSAQLLVGDGSAAQVGYLSNQLIISERSNMIELVNLNNGTVTDNINPVQLPPAPGNDTPVGLATRGSTAFVTIAHSDEVGLVRNGKLVKVLSSGTQHAPCWLTLTGSWLFCSNTPSKSISRYNVSENNIAIAELIAVKTQGEPTDIDAQADILAAIEMGNNGNYLSQFKIDPNGNLKLINSVPTSKNANGIAVIQLQMNTPQQK